MGGANGSCDCAPDDKLRDVNYMVADIRLREGDGFRKCSTHPAGLPYLAPNPARSCGQHFRRSSSFASLQCLSRCATHPLLPASRGLPPIDRPLVRNRVDRSVRMRTVFVRCLLPRLHESGGNRCAPDVARRGAVFAAEHPVKIGQVPEAVLERDVGDPAWRM
jgi:hypothetical protein